MPLDQPTDEDRSQATPKNIEKMRKYATHFAEKSGTFLHPQPEITEFLVIGLAKHIDDLGRPLCPCNFYVDKEAEAKRNEWICACEEMQRYKYCHCLLFVNEEGFPITEHLPEDHEGREIYGLVKDPIPEKGRALARLEEKQGRKIDKSGRGAPGR
jgi:ferredoxin-thioredoxin reductase catalytic chain